MKFRHEVTLYSTIDNLLHPSASPVNSTEFHSLNPNLQFWFSLGLRNFARNCRKLRICNSVFAIFTKWNLCCVDFTKKNYNLRKKSWERISRFSTVWHCGAITLKKFREINSLVIYSVKILIWRKKCWFSRNNRDRDFYEKINIFSTLCGVKPKIPWNQRLSIDFTTHEIFFNKWMNEVYLCVCLISKKWTQHSNQYLDSFVLRTC